MMPRVEWSPHAGRDLRDIYDFIGVRRESPQAARRLIESIRRKSEAYARQPTMGTLHPEIESFDDADPMRSFRVKSYLGFYRETDDGIYVLRVLHGRRDYHSLIGF